jgi:hypothetical protein
MRSIQGSGMFVQRWIWRIAVVAASLALAVAAGTHA